MSKKQISDCLELKSYLESSDLAKELGDERINYVVRLLGNFHLSKAEIILYEIAKKHRLRTIIISAYAENIGEIVFEDVPKDNKFWSRYLVSGFYDLGCSFFGYDSEKNTLMFEGDNAGPGHLCSDGRCLLETNRWSCDICCHRTPGSVERLTLPACARFVEYERLPACARFEEC